MPDKKNTFIPGRLLADNSLIEHQVMPKLRKQRNGGEFLAALKTNIFKANDKVNWKFLKWLLREMGISVMYM